MIGALLDFARENPLVAFCAGMLVLIVFGAAFNHFVPGAKA